MKFSRTAQGRHMDKTFGRPPRPISQHVQAWSERPQKMVALERSGEVDSQGGHLHSLGSQPARAVGKSQPRQVCAWGTRPNEAIRKFMRTKSHIENPHHQAFQAAGAIQKPIRTASQQGAKLKIQGGPSNPSFQMGFNPMSNSKFLLSSQFKSNQPKSCQAKQSQHNPLNLCSLNPNSFRQIHSAPALQVSVLPI